MNHWGGVLLLSEEEPVKGVTLGKSPSLRSLFLLWKEGWLIMPPASQGGLQE